jgi:protein TorT
MQFANFLNHRLHRASTCLMLALVLTVPLSKAQAIWPAKVIADGQPQDYQPVEKAAKQWRICALLPHGKDHYWWGVAWGLSEQAAASGVELGIYEAGGYEFGWKQQQQLQQCRQKQADAYIIAAIHATGLNAEIKTLKAEGKPVIDLINGIDSPDVTAHSAVSFADMARLSLQFIRQQNAQPGRIGWLPGPRGAGWVQDAEQAVNQLQQRYQLQWFHGGYGPPDAFHQTSLARELIEQQPQLDWVLANAVAIRALAQLQVRTKGPVPQLVAYYSNPDVVELLREGRIAAAATDSPVLQARIAVDLAIRLLQQQQVPAQVGPSIQILTPDNLSQYNLQQLLPPDEQWIIRRELLQKETGNQP